MLASVEAVAIDGAVEGDMDDTAGFEFESESEFKVKVELKFNAPSFKRALCELKPLAGVAELTAPLGILEAGSTFEWSLRFSETAVTLALILASKLKADSSLFAFEFCSFEA
jgi:hypothetical protein